MSMPTVLYKRALVPPVVGFKAIVEGVFGHPVIGEAKRVRTSQVVFVAQGGQRFQTKNCRYHMVDSNYEPEGEPDES